MSSEEDDGIRPAGDDPAFDPLIQDSVRDALGNWGASLDREPLDEVPPHVWDRIVAAIEAERDAHDRVGFEVVGATSNGKRRLRALPGSKWTTPLIAASVALLAVAVGASVLGPFGGDGSGTDGPAVVASDAVEPGTFSSEGVAVATDAAPRVVQAGFVPPAKKVMDLRADLKSTDLATAVDEILQDAGIEEPADVLEMPEEQWQPSSDGMMSDPMVLRDCVTKVTKVATSQALLALRAKVNGIDAGLLVVPEFMVDMTQMDGMDAEKMRRMGRQMGVTTIYVVEPTCGMRGPEHDPTVFRVAFTLAP